MGLNQFEKHSKNVIWYFVCGMLGAIFGSMLLILFGPVALFTKVVPKGDSAPAVSSSIQNVSTAAVSATIPENQASQSLTDVGYAANLVMPAVVGIVKPVDNKLSKNLKNILINYSGVIVDKQGYIVTTDLKLAPATELKVILYNGSSETGKILWTDSDLNISLIKINGEGYPYAELGDSQNISVGDTAICIGDPLGLKEKRSVSSGIISEIGRTIKSGEDTYIEDLIQTDAAVNVDNNGGPLINTKGEVIGINTLTEGDSKGIYYASPIDAIKPIINSFKNSGQFITPVLGIRGVDESMSSFFDYIFDKGVFVYDVVPQSPGYAAGIRTGDCITTINGTPINSMLVLRKALYSIGQNGTAIINLVRDNANKEINVTLTPFSE